MSNVGMRIFTEIRRPDKELVKALGTLPVANLDDCMNKIYCVDSQIKGLNADHICGPALTVKAESGNNLMVHKAMDMAQEGDIIVIQGVGNADRSFIGEIMVTYARARKIGGFLIDGYARDIAGLMKMPDCPVFARGLQPNGPTAQAAGEINVPVAIGGQVVMPGDIIVGDRDGVIVIPQNEARSIYDKTSKKHTFEEGVIDKYRNQPVIPGMRKWVDERIEAQKVEIIASEYHC